MSREFLSTLWPWMHIGGRVLFGVSVIVLTRGHLLNTAGLAGYAASAGVPSPKAAVLISGIMAWVGAALIVLGWHRFIGAGLIVLFLLPVSFMMHPYWKRTDPNARMMDTIMFWKNMAMMGGALLIACYAGWNWPYSLGG